MDNWDIKSQKSYVKRFNVTWPGNRMRYSRDANPGSLTPSLCSEHSSGLWVFCFGASPAQLLCLSKNILKDLLAESGERDRHIQRSVPGRWGAWTRVSGGGTKNYRLRLRVCHEEEVVEEGLRGGVQTPCPNPPCQAGAPISAYPITPSYGSHQESWSLWAFTHTLPLHLEHPSTFL